MWAKATCLRLRTPHSLRSPPQPPPPTPTHTQPPRVHWLQTLLKDELVPALQQLRSLRPPAASGAAAAARGGGAGGAAAAARAAEARAGQALERISALTASHHAAMVRLVDQARADVMETGFMPRPSLLDPVVGLHARARAGLGPGAGAAAAAPSLQDALNGQAPWALVTAQELGLPAEGGDPGAGPGPGSGGAGGAAPAARGSCSSGWGPMADGGRRIVEQLKERLGWRGLRGGCLHSLAGLHQGWGVTHAGCTACPCPPAPSLALQPLLPYHLQAPRCLAAPQLEHSMCPAAGPRCTCPAASTAGAPPTRLHRPPPCLPRPPAPLACTAACTVCAPCQHHAPLCIPVPCSQ